MRVREEQVHSIESDAVHLRRGGQVEHVELGEFLSRGQGPEQQELVRLIATLLEEPSGPA